MKLKFYENNMKVELLVELEISKHLENTTFIQDEKILEGNGLLSIHSNTLGCSIGNINKVTIIKENKMTKEQEEILEQDRKDTQEYIDNLSQEELDNIPVEEDLLSDGEIEEMEDNLDILLEQYTSNLEEIEKYKDILRKNIKDTLEDKDSMERCISLGVIQTLLKQLNKENKILLEEIKSLEFDISYYSNLG